MMDAGRLKNYLNKCVRCGQCRSVCPVFEITGEEGAAPRGKVFIVFLLLSGEFTRPDEAGRYLSLCLQCRRCSEQCPSGVPVHQIISRGRKLVSRPWQHIFYDRVLASSSLKYRATQFFQTAENLGLKKLALRLGLLPQWFGKVALSKTPEVPEFTPSRKSSHGTAVYFPGCAATYIMPGIAEATVQLLSNRGWDVVKPNNFSCCGFPHAAAGSDKVKELQKINFKILVDKKPDVIVTSCPTCTVAIKETLEAGQAAIPVMEVTELLAREEFEFKGPVIPTVKVVYHKPCHSSGQTPKNLIEKIPHVKVIPWELEDACCGGGGTFMFQNPALSLKILTPKINALHKTGADVIATGCPACTIQLQRGMGNSAVKIMHPVEILARYLNWPAT